MGRNGIVNLYRRAVATYGASDTATIGSFEEIRMALQQTPPFHDSGDAQIWDGHDASSELDLRRPVPCPHRMLLVDALSKALNRHGAYMAAGLTAAYRWQTTMSCTPSPPSATC
jgi:hypothetical protein